MYIHPSNLSSSCLEATSEQYLGENVLHQIFVQLIQVANARKVCVHYTECPVLIINVFKTRILYKIIPMKTISSSGRIFFFLI